MHNPPLLVLYAVLKTKREEAGGGGQELTPNGSSLGLPEHVPHPTSLRKGAFANAAPLSFLLGLISIPLF